MSLKTPVYLIGIQKWLVGSPAVCATSVPAIKRSLIFPSKIGSQNSLGQICNLLSQCEYKLVIIYLSVVMSVMSDSLI